MRFVPLTLAMTGCTCGLFFVGNLAAFLPLFPEDCADFLRCSAGAESLANEKENRGKRVHYDLLCCIETVQSEQIEHERKNAA